LKTTIYYFTGTGNSLYLAHQLGKQLGNYQIESMANDPLVPEVGGPDENIGFIFPVYFLGLPRKAKQYIEKLKIGKGTYCFAVTNYGRMKFDTLGMLDDILQHKDSKLSYGDGIQMPGNYIINYEAKTPEKIENMMKTANLKIDEVAKTISKKEVRHIRRLGKTRISKWGNNMIYKNIEKFDEKFTVNEDCTGCKTCGDICPVRNIEYKNQNPIWQHHCERCMACIQWCPTEAIQYDHKTDKRRRYHNPNITAKEIIERNTTTKN
jgi:ferredoxin